MLWKGFQKPKRLTVASEPPATNTYSQFSAQPFERGFGTTIGNALRRVLLSSIEGAAITDRKSTRLNSSHLVISYAVFCLKKKKVKTRSATSASLKQSETPQRELNQRPAIVW